MFSSVLNRCSSVKAIKIAQDEDEDEDDISIKSAVYVTVLFDKFVQECFSY